MPTTRRSSGARPCGTSPWTGWASDGPKAAEPRFSTLPNRKLLDKTRPIRPGVARLAANFCSDCGTRLEQQASFCHNCGHQ
ncbi:MAG: zinc ribbon domain-containing protein, partial [Thermoplasmata archaeon]|nr:zinc ribbon domain-containing protein [Thermoplasmata archaeon]